MILFMLLQLVMIKNLWLAGRQSSSFCYSKISLAEMFLPSLARPWQYVFFLSQPLFLPGSSCPALQSWQDWQRLWLRKHLQWLSTAGSHQVVDIFPHLILPRVPTLCISLYCWLNMSWNSCAREEYGVLDTAKTRSRARANPHFLQQGLWCPGSGSARAFSINISGIKIRFIIRIHFKHQ